MNDTFADPARIDPRLASRSISFENPTQPSPFEAMAAMIGAAASQE